MGRGTPAAAKSKYMAGQVVFYVSVVVCVLVRPRSLAANAGISYFGNFGDTIVPYGVGLLGSALSLYLVSTDQVARLSQLARFALRLIALLVVGVVATPYRLGEPVSNLHTLLGTCVFVVQLLLTAVMVRELGHRPWWVGAWLTQLGAGVVCALYIRPPHGLLIQFEMLFEVIFSVVVYGYVRFGAVAGRQPWDRSGTVGQQLPSLPEVGPTSRVQR